MATEMPPTAPDAEESAESISAPVSALGGAAVGDTVTFTVDSIDGDTASLSPSQSEETEQAPMGKGISEAAKLFNGDEE